MCTVFFLLMMSNDVTEGIQFHKDFWHLTSKSEHILWVLPSYSKEQEPVIWNCFPKKDFAVRVIENLKGSTPEVIYVHGYPENWKRHEKCPVLLFVNQDDSGAYISNSSRSFEVDYLAIRPFIKRYLEIDVVPPSEYREHLLIEWALDMFEQIETRSYGASRLKKIVKNREMTAYAKLPIWERVGPDPNPMTLTQRARLMNSMGQLSPYEIFLLDLAWPFNRGFEAQIRDLLPELRTYLRPQVSQAILNRYKAPAVHAIIKKNRQIQEQIKALRRGGPVNYYRIRDLEDQIHQNYLDILDLFDCLLSESGPEPDWNSD